MADRRFARTDPLRAEYGARLRAARLERGLTQDAVALVLGVSRTYIVDLEAGRRLESWPAWLAMMVAMGYDPRIVAPELVTLLDNVSAPVTGDDLNTAETPQTVDAQRPKRGKHK